jgi:hypothetical protein
MAVAFARECIAANSDAAALTFLSSRADDNFGTATPMTVEAIRRTTTISRTVKPDEAFLDPGGLESLRTPGSISWFRGHKKPVLSFGIRAASSREAPSFAAPGHPGCALIVRESVILHP